MTTLVIAGGGSWGTALSIALAPRFDVVRLLVHEGDVAATMRSLRENLVFLPGFRLPDNVEPLTGTDALTADLLLGVMPSQHAREVYTHLELRAGVPIISATKGLERNSLWRMSEIIREAKPQNPVAVLSGPTFAREVARGDPTAMVIASEDPALGVEIQQAFSSPNLRLYTNNDVTGVELAASLKNVIAIGAGVVKGLGLGGNTLAALITRGLTEITRLVVAAGGEERTLAGLAGLGDLVLTCTGDLSRNRQVGLDLANGISLREIVRSSRMVAEGIETTHAARRLAGRLGVEMPITEELALLLEEKKSAREAIRDLMERSLKGE